MVLAVGVVAATVPGALGLRLVIACWTALFVGIALLASRPSKIELPGAPIELLALVPLAMAGGRQIGLRHAGGTAFADEAWALPVVGESLKDYYVSDPGMPGFVLHAVVAAVDGFGSFAPLAAVMAVMWALMVLAVWSWGRREFSAPATCLLVAAAFVIPEASAGLLDQLAQARAYIMFVPLCTIGLAFAAADRTRSRDAAVFATLGLASLDNPLCLTLLVGFSVSSGLGWIRDNRAVYAERLVAAVGGLGLVVGMNAFVAASDQVARSGRAGDDWLVAQLLLVAVPIGVVARRGPWPDAARAWLLGALAVVVAVIMGVLPDAQRIGMFLAPAGWVLAAAGVMRLTSDPLWPRIVSVIAFAVTWSFVHTGDIGRTFGLADPWRLLWKVGLGFAVAWTLVAVWVHRTGEEFKKQRLFEAFLWFTVICIALSLSGHRVFESQRFVAKQAALAVAWGSGVRPIRTTDRGPFHLLPPGALMGVRVADRMSAYEVLGEALIVDKQVTCAPGTWVVPSTSWPILADCGCQPLWLPGRMVSGNAVGVCDGG